MTEQIKYDYTVIKTQAGEYVIHSPLTPLLPMANKVMKFKCTQSNVNIISGRFKDWDSVKDYVENIGGEITFTDEPDEPEVEKVAVEAPEAPELGTKLDAVHREFYAKLAEAGIDHAPLTKEAPEPQETEPIDDYVPSKEVYFNGRTYVLKEHEPTAGLKPYQIKPPFNLIPPHALRLVAIAMGEGAEKYGENNYIKDGINVDKYIGKSLRHINSFQRGVGDVDDLAHAVADLMMIIDQIKRQEAGNANN